MKRLQEIYEYRDMIASLVKRELRGRYQKSVLGMLWTLLNPLFQIAIYTLVFTIIFPSSLEHYAFYLTSGMIPWTFFNEAAGQGAGCIIGNADMTKKIYFPRETLVISSVTAKLVNLLIAFTIVFLFAFLGGVGISTETIWMLPFVMLVEYLTALGFALFFASVTVYFRDMEHIVSVLMMAWIWATPVMYTPSTVPEELQNILRLNPMTGIIEMYHDILYYQKIPAITECITMLIVSLIIVALGECIFLRLEGNFAEEL